MSSGLLLRRRALLEASLAEDLDGRDVIAVDNNGTPWISRNYGQDFYPVSIPTITLGGGAVSSYLARDVGNDTTETLVAIGTQSGSALIGRTGLRNGTTPTFTFTVISSTGFLAKTAFIGGDAPKLCCTEKRLFGVAQSGSGVVAYKPVLVYSSNTTPPNPSAKLDAGTGLSKLFGNSPVLRGTNGLCFETAEGETNVRTVIAGSMMNSAGYQTQTGVNWSACFPTQSLGYSMKELRCSYDGQLFAAIDSSDQIVLSQDGLGSWGVFQSGVEYTTTAVAVNPDTGVAKVWGGSRPAAGIWRITACQARYYSGAWHWGSTYTVYTDPSGTEIWSLDCNAKGTRMVGIKGDSLAYSSDGGQTWNYSTIHGTAPDTYKDLHMVKYAKQYISG